MHNMIILLNPQILISQTPLISPPVTRSKNINMTKEQLANINSESSEKNNKGFTFSYANADNLYFLNWKHSAVTVSDSTHKTIRKSDLKLFTVWFFDSHICRRNLATMLLGSECERSICHALEKIKNWGLSTE